MLRTEFCITGESNALLKGEIFLALVIYNHIFFQNPTGWVQDSPSSTHRITANKQD